jgi:NADH-quinone oxidoreductase subunit L
MMALSGVPIFFSGFWSKDEILHAANAWKVSSLPFYMGVFGALLTAFYMTRQMFYVFAGKYRSGDEAAHGHSAPHESPRVMTLPLVILAIFAVVLGFIGTPVWPWFQSYLGGEKLVFGFHKLMHPDVLWTMAVSVVIVAIGVGLGYALYGRKPIESAEAPDALERIGRHTFLLKDVIVWLQHKLYFDEFYEATVVRLNAIAAWLCDTLDYWLWNGAVMAVGYIALGLSWVNRVIDEQVINGGFDQGCRGARGGGKLFALAQNGRVQNYLRIIGVALAALVLFLMWGCQAS